MSLLLFFSEPGPIVAAALGARSTMENPGQVELTFDGGASFPIAGPGVMIGDWIEDLAGMVAAAIQVRFAYGAGGSRVDLYIQTSSDQGASQIDVAAFEFTTANDVEVVNLCALTPQTAPITPTQLALAPATCVDGILGDRLRAVAVVTGTYGASTGLKVTAVTR